MRKVYLMGLAALLGMVLVSCKGSPKLRVEKSGADSMIGVTQIDAQQEQTLKVVTGGKATTLDDRATNGMQEKDKTGSVAVKVEY